MQKTLVFDAISDIDETLIDACLNEDTSKAFTSNKTAAMNSNTLWIKVVLACAISAAAALLILVVPKILKNIGISPDYHFGDFSFTVLAAEVPLSDVYVEGVAEADNAGQYAQTPGDAKYVFNKPSQDAMKYVGFWLSKQCSQALLLKNDGSFVIYVQYSKTLLRFGDEGYYSIENGKIRLFSPGSAEYSECSITYKNNYIILTDDYNDSARFDLANIKDYTFKPMEDKTSQDAMDFRNITWALDDENTHISFWNNEVMTITIYEENAYPTHVEEYFVWDKEANTVCFSDWHEGSKLLLTGMIEGDTLILSNGNIRYVLSKYVYDPNVYSQELQIGKPYYCTRGNPKDYRVAIIFEEDGRYVLTAADNSGTLLTDKYFIEGTYEYHPDEQHPYRADGPEVSGVLQVNPPNGELDYMGKNTDIRPFFEALSLPWIIEYGSEIFIDEEGVVIITYRRVFTDELIVSDSVKLSPK